MRVLAQLLEAMGVETPYGGRAVTYEPLGSVWLRIEGRRRRDRNEAGQGVSIETAAAESRADPRLIEDRVVRFGGADWAIRDVVPDPDRPGRAKLNLERSR